MDVNPNYSPELALWHLADGEDGTTWHMSPMFTTWALTGTPADQRPGYYTWRWCFRGQLELLAAVEAWDPATQDEPNGYVKRKGERREAPDRLTLPEYNRRRCAHGHYVVDRDCPHVACEGWHFAP